MRLGYPVTCWGVVEHWHRSQLGLWCFFTDHLLEASKPWRWRDSLPEDLLPPHKTPPNNSCNRERRRQHGKDPGMHIRMVKVTGSEDPRMSKKDTEWSLIGRIGLA